jgi:hypothetical protein
MDGFINHIVNKMPGKTTADNIDTLIRIYSDPGKRGKNGPPTTLYLIPTNEKDWAFLANKQGEIKVLRNFYNSLTG